MYTQTIDISEIFSENLTLAGAFWEFRGCDYVICGYVICNVDIYIILYFTYHYIYINILCIISHVHYILHTKLHIVCNI